MAERRNEMGKKILILGTGAQGSTVAQRMDEEPNVEKSYAQMQIIKLLMSL